METRLTLLRALLCSALLALGPGNAAGQKQTDYVQVVEEATPQVHLASSAASAVFGTTVTFTATLTGAGSPPTGSAVFFSGNSQLGSVVLNSAGVAAFQTASLLPGENTITAFYPGDLNYHAASSPPVVVAITALTPQVIVTPSVSTITNTQSVQVQVQVVAGGSSPTPTGTVLLSGGFYHEQQALTQGTAVFTISAESLNSGANSLSVRYSGDGFYNAASGTATVTVSQVAITVPPLAPAAPGAAVAATASVRAGSGYSGVIDLTCALATAPAGAQNLPTCSFNPAVVTLAQGGVASAVFTVRTSAGSAVALEQPYNPKRFQLAASGLAMAGLFFAGVFSRRRRWLFMVALLGVAFAGAAAGCGGGIQFSCTPSAPRPVPATTAGAYMFIVTATDASNRAIASSATVAVTVQ